MKHNWLNNVLPIAALFAFRMLGLFMLIPVFTIFASELRGATPTLIGLALGSYGLSQGILQMPFGMLSDRFGRKPLLYIGLLLFFCGSLIGAFSHSIYTMIIARILQGSGAIGSVLIALVADLTPNEKRTQAMAVIGMSIALAFGLAMVVSPALTSYFGLHSIFYLSAFLAFFGLLILHFRIPTPTKEPFHLDSEANSSLFRSVIFNKDLRRLNEGIFLQHYILTATFYTLPLLLKAQGQGGNLNTQWQFYLPLILFSFIAMMPFILLAEKRKQIKSVFIFSVLVTSLCQVFLAISNLHWMALWLLMFFYFIAFNILEATLPSLVSKQADVSTKGTAMGIYSSCQFLGIFAGGSTAGLIYQFAGSSGIFIINGLLAFIWFLLSLPMKPEAYLSNLILNYPSQVKNEIALIGQLKLLKGIKDILLVKEEALIYLRIDPANYRPGSAETKLKELASIKNQLTK